MDVLSSFGVEWRLLVASTINFVILLYLLNKILYRPLLAVLDERRAKIAESLKNAAEIEQKLAAIAEQERTVLHQARLEAEQLLVRAEERAKAREGEMIKTATERAHIIVRQSEERMSEQARVMKKQIEQSVAELVVRATRAILQERMPVDITEDYATKTLQRIKK